MVARQPARPSSLFSDFVLRGVFQRDASHVSSLIDSAEIGHRGLLVE
jgi:hypothetical protein